MKHFDQELLNILNVLKPLLEEIKKTSTPEDKIGTGDTQKLLHLLLELEPHVNKRKPMLCKAIIEKIEKYRMA